MTFDLVLEEFVTGFINRHNQEYVEVFVNPAKRQINELAEKFHKKEYVRYIADGDNKKLYVFPPSVLHLDVIKQIGEDRYLRYPSEYLYLMGVAVKEDGNWGSKHSNSFSSTDEYDSEFVLDVLDVSWNWTKRYHLDLGPLLAKMIQRKSVYNDDLESGSIA